jgi:hypothetical protein
MLQKDREKMSEVQLRISKEKLKLARLKQQEAKDQKETTLYEKYTDVLVLSLSIMEPGVGAPDPGDPLAAPLVPPPPADLTPPATRTAIQVTHHHRPLAVALQSLPEAPRPLRPEPPVPSPSFSSSALAWQCRSFSSATSSPPLHPRSLVSLRAGQVLSGLRHRSLPLRSTSTLNKSQTPSPFTLRLLLWS